MKMKYSLLIAVITITGCSSYSPSLIRQDDHIRGDAERPFVEAVPRQSMAVNDALMPPLRVEIPRPATGQVEQRFDLLANCG